MINVKNLIEEDVMTIMWMAKEIKTAAEKVTAESLVGQVKINLFKEALEDKSIKYAFNSLNEVGIAAYYFFGSTYTAKRLARNSYIYDEDEVFVESIDCDTMLGYVKLPNGAIVESGTVEFTMKVRRYNDRNKRTGFPFDIIDIKLISPEM